MAELAVFTLSSKVLSTIASTALNNAYEKGCSIWEARDDLRKLRETIETIHAVLLDAERKQEGSAAVRSWIKRVKAVLYDADDLFDEVSTDDMLRRRIKGSPLPLLEKVRVILSSNSLAQKIRAIRKSLLEISTDMAQFGFARCEREGSAMAAAGMMMRRGQDPGSFVDPKHVCGRDEDKKAVLGMLLLHDPGQDVSLPRPPVVVIAIVGIGGMGKTTLAQLVYNDQEVQRGFEKRWFACISDTSDDREIVGKIFQSIHGGDYGDFTVAQLQSKIRESIRGVDSFLLVLDDVWDDDHGRWQDRMSLLSSSSSSSGSGKGGKIIVTTRSSSVAKAMDALETRVLCGLSEDDSWNLFKRVAFTPEQERDSRWSDLGRKIVKKCANVPLAIKSIGSLLYTKSTMREWESFSEEELPKLGGNNPDPTMSVLKLSYDHLNSNLKQCFAYCSLFPKDFVISKQKLIYLWVAQGYVKPDNETQTVEEAGHSYFMDLLRRSFFQETREDECGEIECCKMHDLVHDLARHVAGEECIMLTKASDKVKVTRQLSVGYAIDDSWAIPATILNVHQLRSLLFMDAYSTCGPALVQQFAHLKFLRALSLSRLRIENLPSSIGELKHLRYLDVSGNWFKKLPGSVTKLLNLCMLDVSNCRDLEALPNDFRKLINLRHLENSHCGSWKHMPPGFEELTCLQHLHVFKAGGGKSAGRRSKMDALVGLKLRGSLRIYFEDHTCEDWDGVEYWQPPANIQGLVVIHYRGTRIPHWGNASPDNPTSVITRLNLYDCSRVKCLPPFRHLPNLRFLHLDSMVSLEYIVGEEEEINPNALSLPRLEGLKLRSLPTLKGWSRKAGATTSNDEVRCCSFRLLSSLRIEGCPELKSMPLCPCLESLRLHSVNAELVPQLVSSSSLARVQVERCDGLTSLPGGPLTSLSSLCIVRCKKLKDVVVAPSHLNILEHLTIVDCPELELWEEEKAGVDWISLPNLRTLEVDKVPSLERLPTCLKTRQADGKLDITLRHR